MMYKEPLKVMLYNATGDKNIDYTVDYGDGNVGHGKSSTVLKYTYSQPGTYSVKVTQGSNVYEEDVTVYDLLALTEAMKQFKEAGNKTVWAMTHRSHTSDKAIPENSVSAVAAAIASNADVIECDTHRTKDGVVVVCHDLTIDATTNGKGDITQMTYAELMQYNLTDRSGRVTNEKMPTLEEFLKAGKGKVYFNLDYSPRTASTKEVMDIVKDLEMMEQVFFYCNNATKTSEVIKHTPEAHAYTWGQGAYSPLVGLKGNYFVQFTYTPNGGSTPIGSSERDGMITTANLLHVLNGSIPEYDINNNQLDDLLNVYPNIHMIQTDVPDKLIPLLRNKGLHK
ncbi:MAG: PKD domain-containing protein [Clostridiales bacterium]|nr:PKD domain-containing protein [Clostridiales bacterium]